MPLPRAALSAGPSLQDRLHGLAAQARGHRWLGRVIPQAGEVLLCHHDGLVLQARVARGGELSPPVRSGHADPAKALEEIVESVRRAGTAVPSRAILATPQVVTALLTLPVDPAKPRPKPQMREIIRWEIEPEFGTFAEIWSVADILCLRGDLDPAALAALGEEAGGHGRATMVSRRLIDLAVERGLVAAAAVTAAGAIQERLSSIDEDILCGWVTPRDGGGAQAGWPCCAIGRSARDAWAGLFAESGVRLTRLVPALGLAAAAGGGGKGDRMVIEGHPGRVAVVVIAPDGAMRALRVEALRGREPAPVAADLCRDLVRPAVVRIETIGAEGLAAALSPLLGRRVEAAAADPVSALAALTVARHKGRPQIPWVEGADPPPPPWRRPDTLRIGAVVLTLVALAGTEIHMRSSMAAKEETLNRLDREYEEKQAQQRKMQQLFDEAKVKQTELDLRRRELDEVRQSLKVTESVLMMRQVFVPGLLAAIQESVTDEVIIDSLHESGQASASFELRGWAVTETAAQLFFNRIAAAVADWDLVASNTIVRRGRGRLDVDGYVLSLRLSPLPKQKANPELESSAAKKAPAKKAPARKRK